MTRLPSLLTPTPPHAIVYDARHIFVGIAPALRDYLNEIYFCEAFLPQDTVEGLPLHELVKWWTIVNLETMWCLPLVASCVFPGSAQLRHALESFSYERSSLLYFAVPIEPVEDRLVKITPRLTSIVIEFI